jgi:hypothetical protein
MDDIKESVRQAGIALARWARAAAARDKAGTTPQQPACAGLGLPSRFETGKLLYHSRLLPFRSAGACEG